MTYLLLKRFRALYEKRPYDVVVECSSKEQVDRVKRVYADKCDSISTVDFSYTTKNITISAD